MQVTPLDVGRKEEAVDVVVDAFFDYPVMRFVIGSEGAAYARRARLMVDFFTTARFLGDDLVMGVTNADGALVAVANVTRPGQRPKPSALVPLREALWRELGDDARTRYEELGRIWQAFASEQPHYHLNMLGVRRSHQKRGAARLLLDALHERSARAPDSCGVSLTTEDPSNVPFYERFGYRIVGKRSVGGFTTRGFFRPNAGCPSDAPGSCD